jgi:predicted HNH restriction endonuclease
MELVESINEAVQNAEEFNQLSRNSDSEALRVFSQFSHWYYFSDLGIFAPCKFIGYKCTTLSDYEGEGKGGETKKRLSKWFKQVPTDTEIYESLRIKLEAYAKSVGKTIGKKTFGDTGGIYLLSEEFATSNYPDEVDSSGYAEGATKQVTINAFERNSKARAECIMQHGTSCYVCKFDFSKTYGKELGAEFIHVHHLKEISKIKKEYIVNPVKDLLPLCPNCHAMVHKRKPALHPDQLKKIMRELSNNDDYAKEPIK